MELSTENPNNDNKSAIESEASSKLSPVNGPWTSAKIGICFSGGGYRAAAFHLGTLSYLSRIGLAKNISSISTISGGSFTGAMYMISLIEGEPFQEFFTRFCGLLAKTDLVDGGLSRLPEPKRTASERKTLIVAMAETYAETFFKKTDGKPYLFNDIIGHEGDLPDISLNATEFRTGVAFRFQTRGGSIVGNSNVAVSRVPRKSTDAAGLAGGARVADIVAASSCFPGGFEPLGFPADFVWPDEDYAKKIGAELQKKGEHPNVALMDGGVYDNQGAQTLDLAVHKNSEDLSLFLISDSDPGATDLFPYPEKEQSVGFLGRRTLKQVPVGALGLTIVSGLSALALGYQMGQQIKSDSMDLPIDFFLYFFPFLLVILTFAGLWMVRSAFRKKVLPAVPKIGKGAWSYLKNVTIDQSIDMVKLRLSSLMAMASSVFMTRIRRLVYDRIHTDDRYNGKRVSNMIYDLKKGASPGQNLDPPSEKLIELSENASAMPTTLWFDKRDDLRMLVSCGQATTCFNILENLRERFGPDEASYPEDVRTLWDRLVADWEKFGEDPRFAFDEMIGK